ncbi:MAG: hypothetical protein J5744_09135 [Oscillospiraceae bacterium]|nr:hypothetical protein [Oscillospiraceae bacterium]
MCERKCEDMRNLDAMHCAVMSVLSARTEFSDEDDAKAFYDVACRYLSSILFAKYRRNSTCPLIPEAKR